MRAAGRIGLNVIVDEVVIDRTSWDDWNAALVGLDLVWVGVRCSPEVAEERNRRRRNARFPGLARALSISVHLGVGYDFQIDTTTQSPQEALLELNLGLGFSRPPPHR